MPKAKRITLYLVEWCPHCVRAREFLRNEGILFEVFDVEADDVAWKRAMSLTGGVDIVPVIDIDGTAVWGAFTGTFESNLRRLLGINER